MKNLLRNSILSSVAATVLIGATMPSVSVAASVFPGAMCQHISGAKPRFNDGAIYNQSASRSMRVICPVPLDTSAFAGGTWVMVTDRSGGAGSQNVRCELKYTWERDGLSQPVQSRDVVRSTGFSSNVQKLEFDTSNFTRSALARIEAHSYITCILPPRTPTGPSEIHSYSNQN